MSYKDKLNKLKESSIKLADKVKTVAEPAVQTSMEKLDKSLEFVGEKSGQAKEKIIQKATELSPEGVEKIKESSEKVKAFGEKASGVVSEKAGLAKDAIVEKATEISPDGVEKIKQTSDLVKTKTSEMNLMNSTIKKEAIDDLNKANEIYEQTYSDAVQSVVGFHESKNSASKLLKDIEDYINSIANSPKEIKNTVSEITVNRQAYDELINDLEIENEKNVKIGGGVAGAGILAGAGVAAFGPTAAIAIATTFGTASTGVAISSLTGAAATKAALAWLGGGAIAAGGGGVAGGNALLAMAGPVGWTIGGVALVGSGMFLSYKNKKIAADAAEARADIEKETTRMNKIRAEVEAAQTQLNEQTDGLKVLLRNLRSTGITDYTMFSKEEKFNLGSLVNLSKALSEFINKGLEADE